MTEPMMERDMIHPFLPASNTVIGIESCFTKAASIGGWWLHLAEMGQAMENPFPVVGNRKSVETV